ncbi:hypothetical protein GGS23DRAFT_575870 [Durotheca rogersii]|uniref:uncharacterized protein n=1 Tax=Durotheca rogersii TaxID=419775 RepID=UPI00221E517E|nr:uncharacterized protein GGS23DRAFT_575870 [Durotheca rogersii]KAI5861610.1 hypothetical protein GGS23DRAFT_575870 [Durotheca rogersii]
MSLLLTRVRSRARISSSSSSFLRRHHPRSPPLAPRAAFASLAGAEEPTVVSPSEAEVRAGALSRRNLERAVGAVHRDGLVVVEGVVPHAALDRLNARMVSDARVLQARGDEGPFNYNTGNLQQGAPPVAEFFDPEVFVSESRAGDLLSLPVPSPPPPFFFLLVDDLTRAPLTNRAADPIATQVTSGVLGPRPLWTFCSANTAVAGAGAARQPVHSDADFAHPDHAFALVVNVPLVATAAANGATELWLGTHTAAGGGGVAAQEGAHGERTSGRIREAQLAARRAARPPCQPPLAKGSLVVRDLRLWHAGMPNRGEPPRVMLAMIHFAPWYRSRMRLQLADDVRPLLERLERDGRLCLDVPVDWIPRDRALGTYLDRGFGNSYDFDQEP